MNNLAEKELSDSAPAHWCWVFGIIKRKRGA